MPIVFALRAICTSKIHLWQKFGNCLIFRAEVRRSFITTTVREESQVTPQGRHRLLMYANFFNICIFASLLLIFLAGTHSLQSFGNTSFFCYFDSACSGSTMSTELLAPTEPSLLFLGHRPATYCYYFKHLEELCAVLYSLTDRMNCLRFLLDIAVLWHCTIVQVNNCQLSA